MSTTNGMVIPDGNWVMPSQLFLSCEGLNISGYSYVRDLEDETEEVYVRFTCASGEISDFNYAISEGNWYRSMDGRPYARGYEFIDTLEELVALSSDLPYGWRE